MADTRATRPKSVFIVIVLILTCLLSPACGTKSVSSSGSDNGANIESSGIISGIVYDGILAEWSSDALKVAFLYPEAARIRVYPGEDELVRVVGPGELKIGLRIKIPEVQNESEFKTYMEQSFDRMPASTNGFQEYHRKLFDLNGHPAAYIEYQWTVMKREFRVLELNVMKGQHQYVLLSTFLLQDDSNYLTAAQTVFNSFRLLEGEPNLAGLKAEDGSTEQGASSEQSSTETDGQSAKLVCALTKEKCREGLILNAINSEYGDTARLADWKTLKEQYRGQLPEMLAEIGLGNGQAAWVVSDGREFSSGKRHYFIQRFDGGRPSDFLAHDQVGTISLGSWYNMEMPVLVVIKPI